MPGRTLLGMNGSMSRRSILAAGVAGSAAVLLGTGHASAASLVSHNEINSQPTFYEVNGAATSFRYEPGFYSRLETWHVHWRNWTPAHWTAPHKIYSYGAYVDKPGMHGEGRAFDLARMLITNRDTGAMFTAFNGRYDQWRNLTGDALRTARIRYWGTMASLHYHFRHVISYLDNAEHHNHAHIDNAVSGSGDSSFNTGSATQTYFVQAACQYIWGLSTGIDGDWGPETQRNSSTALARAGSDGVITTQSRWLTFCKASAQKAWALVP
jgi:hypothetical protein